MGRATELFQLDLQANVVSWHLLWRTPEGALHLRAPSLGWPETLLREKRSKAALELLWALGGCSSCGSPGFASPRASAPRGETLLKVGGKDSWFRRTRLEVFFKQRRGKTAPTSPGIGTGAAGGVARLHPSVSLALSLQDPDLCVGQPPVADLDKLPRCRLEYVL